MKVVSDAETRAVRADVVTAELEADEPPTAPTAKRVVTAPAESVEVVIAEALIDADEELTVPLAVMTALKNVNL